MIVRAMMKRFHNNDVMALIAFAIIALAVCTSLFIEREMMYRLLMAEEDITKVPFNTLQLLMFLYTSDDQIVTIILGCLLAAIGLLIVAAILAAAGDSVKGEMAQPGSASDAVQPQLADHDPQAKAPYMTQQPTGRPDFTPPDMGDVWSRFRNGTP